MADERISMMKRGGGERKKGKANSMFKGLGN